MFGGFFMKNVYLEPELEITEFETEDVLTTSSFKRADDETELIGL